MEKDFIVTAQATASGTSLTAGGGTFSAGPAVVTLSESGRLLLWTGMGDKSGQWVIEHGLDQRRMLEYCSLADLLWTTWGYRNAWGYADLSVGYRMHGENKAVVGLGVLPGMVQGFFDSGLAGVSAEDQAIWFSPETFPALTATAERSLHLSIDLTIEG